MVYIDCSNLRGLGARKVGVTIISNLRIKYPHEKLGLIIPDKSFLSEVEISNFSHIQFPYFNRYFYAAIRFLYIMFGCIFFKRKGLLYTLGDIPILFKNQQVVFVQQAHLLKPDFEPSVAKSLGIRIQRLLFRWGTNNVISAQVQSAHMARLLVKSYPKLKGKVEIKPITYFFNKKSVDFHFITDSKDLLLNRHGHINKLSLIYPASLYPHKNHEIIHEIGQNWDFFDKYLDVLFITIEKNIFTQYPFVKNLGTLSYSEADSFYRKLDGLFFPSKLESFGLPLYEFQDLKKIIICPNLNYSENLHGEKIIKFEIDNINSLKIAVKKAYEIKQAVANSN